MNFSKIFALLLALTSSVAASEEDFEAFSPGQVISEIVRGDGYTIEVVAKGCSGKAMIFDSAMPTGSDSDLMTPGPGIGNTLPRGNILIVSEDGDSSDPDDCGYGGVLKFKFDPLAYVSSIGLLDVEEGARILVFPSKRSSYSYAIDVPNTTNNGYVSVPINDNVAKINVKFFASGAVTEIEYGCQGTLMDAGNGIEGCWYTAPLLGMNCNDVCTVHGGFDAVASKHSGNAVGFHFWPDKNDGHNWVSIECSSTDNNTNWGANGQSPNPNFSHPACYVNCACKN